MELTLEMATAIVKVIAADRPTVVINSTILIATGEQTRAKGEKLFGDLTIRFGSKDSKSNTEDVGVS